jgi:hypothetical protein
MSEPFLTYLNTMRKTRQFQCIECKAIIEYDPTQECGPSLLTGKRAPLHCGRSMIEVVD